LKGQAPGVSKSTIRLVEDMMAYRTEDRPQDYDALLREIEQIEKRQFGVKRRASGRGRKTQTKWIVAGVFSALTVVAVSTYVTLTKGDSGSGNPGDLGIGSGERVISAGDDSNAQKFLEARSLLSKGEFRTARDIFDDLAAETLPSPTTRMWTLYFQGLTRLYLGDEEGARDAFGLIAAIEPEQEGANGPISDFMRKASPVLADPLPVLAANEMFSPDSIELAGILAAGLKNWQRGEFASGIELLEAFSASTPPEDLSWMAPLKGSVDTYRRDFAKLKDIPNPSRESAGDLAALRRELETFSGVVRTPGAVPRLVRSRLARISRIEELVATEKEEERIRQERIARAKAGASKGKGSKSEPPSGNNIGPAVMAERKRLLELLESLSGYGDTLLFSEAIAKLQEEGFETDQVRRWRDDLVAGYRQADVFVEMLSTRLNDGAYEGEVRRRVGVPVEAKITAADPNRFVVDLGFGPNDVEVEEFAPDWLVEAAVEVLSEPAAETAADWKSVVFFALATGQSAEADRIGNGLAEIDEEFGQRWRRLGELGDSGN
jgi:hypothetical protein